MQFTVTQDLGALQAILATLAGEGRRIALVPTMGALHDGHMALVKAARERADAVVLSIFVNPKQFGPNEDFAKYPRTLEADLALARQEGVTVAYTPPVEDVYPPGFTTTVSVGDMGKILCGAHRPGHFSGMLTVVTKLLLRTLPQVALFGEKDYQQLCIIRRVVADLDIPIEIAGVPTLREEDGLALSSRNTYLSPEERALAPKLYHVLAQTARHIKEQGMDVKEAVKMGTSLLASAGFRMDYMELRAADTLSSLEKYHPNARLLAAAWLGKTRLIDNVGLE